MVINTKNGKDTITVDVRCNQIRYVKSNSEILFYDISRDTSDAFEYLHKNHPNQFKESLAEDCGECLGIDVDPTKLTIKEH